MVHVFCLFLVVSIQIGSPYLWVLHPARIENIQKKNKIPESSKKQNLNLTYVWSIYRAFTLYYALLINLEMI